MNYDIISEYYTEKFKKENIQLSKEWVATFYDKNIFKMFIEYDYPLMKQRSTVAFDNILITHDEHCAEAFADSTFRVKHQLEMKEHPHRAKRNTIPIAENIKNKVEEEYDDDEDEWVVKRKAKMSFPQFINNLIDETFHWDYDENRYYWVEKGLYGLFIGLVLLIFVVYYKNREFLHKAKIL